MGAEPDTHNPSAPTVAVLGGGLAGLSAARRLLNRRLGVVLIEKRPFLGGRAYSFRDRESGVEIDNGQHVFLGCNTYFIEYLREIGALDKAHLQDRLNIPVVRNGVKGSLFSVRWLGPLHLLPSFVRYAHLNLNEKLQVAYGLLMVKLTRRSAPGLDRETAYDWLRRHGQSDGTIEKLWNLVILPSLNDDVRDASAAMALMVFQEALLKQPSYATVGFARVGLTAFAGEPAKEYIEDRGGRLILGRTSSSLKMADGRIDGIELTDGSVIQADAYVSALPFDVLLEMLSPGTARDGFFSPASELATGPIVGIHLWYDRPIMEEDFVAFLDSPVQWVFNKSRIMGAPGDGQYVYISLSGAWEHIDEPKDSLKATFAAEMARLFPRAGRAEITRSLVVKEPRATFRSTPGASKHRLPQATPIPNLFLAGDWTDTGWPSTMEGAVRSGVFAADAAASSLTPAGE